MIGTLSLNSVRRDPDSILMMMYGGFALAVRYNHLICGQKTAGVTVLMVVRCVTVLNNNEPAMLWRGCHLLLLTQLCLFLIDPWVHAE